MYLILGIAVIVIMLVALVKVLVYAKTDYPVDKRLDGLR